MAAGPTEHRRQIDSLRQAISEGARTLHRAVEIVAIQDVQHPVHEPELQVIGRGIEVLGKAAWILNERILVGEFRSATPIGHDLVRLLGELECQAHVRRQPSVFDDPVMQLIADVATDFAMGGRFRHLDGLVSGEPHLPPYLAWNEGQITTARLAPEPMDDVERTVFLRSVHTSVLQHLERALASHLLTAQREIWGDVIVQRAWLESTTARPDEQLATPIPLEFGHRSCNCSHIDYRAVAIWVPVEG